MKSDGRRLFSIFYNPLNGGRGSEFAARQGVRISLQVRNFARHARAVRQGAQVAQLVEQGIENPRVGGSIPSLGTIFSIG